MLPIKGPVLVAATFDESIDEALRQGGLLARAHGVDLEVCHVLPEIFAVRPLFPQLHLDDSLKLSQFEAAVRGTMEERVRTATCRDAGDIVLHIEHGTPHSGILRAAERIHAGAIVIGEDREANHAANPGRVAERVVRAAQCPVLVVRPSREGKVLAATDFSDLALPAVEAAASEARRRGTELAVIHSVDVLPLAMYPVYSASWTHSEDLLVEMSRVWQHKLDECVRTFAAGAGGLLRHGPAVPVILQAAEDLPAQLIVVGTHGRTGLQHLTLGSVAEGVVRGARCSVLVVRLGAAHPPGRSPQGAAAPPSS